MVGRSQKRFGRWVDPRDDLESGRVREAFCRQGTEGGWGPQIFSTRWRREKALSQFGIEFHPAALNSRLWSPYSTSASVVQCYW
jgi:hypothetical protein